MGNEGPVSSGADLGTPLHENTMANPRLGACSSSAGRCPACVPKLSVCAARGEHTPFT